MLGRKQGKTDAWVRELERIEQQIRGLAVSSVHVPPDMHKDIMQTVDPNSIECASCGVRKDRHGTQVICPRYVAPVNPPVYPPGFAGVPVVADPNLPPGQVVVVKKPPQPVASRQGLDPNYYYYPKEYQGSRQGERSARNDMEYMAAKIDHLTRGFEAVSEALAEVRRENRRLRSVIESPDFDPVVRRLGRREKIDYTQWRDDEDNLTDPDENHGFPSVPHDGMPTDGHHF